MPASIHGEETCATKLASVHKGDAERGLPTVNAQIVLTDARTGRPLAFIEGSPVGRDRGRDAGPLAGPRYRDGD